jgi:CubicO group peptidase (beta-lactamase class C family)
MCDLLSAAVLLAATVLSASASTEEIWPTSEWTHATPAEMGMDGAKLRLARDYALTGGGSGFIIRGGRLVMSWGSPTRLYDLKSTTKSIGVTALGLAIKDGRMHLNDKAKRYHPSLGVPPEGNLKTGWLDLITILHLATHTAGFAKPGGYTKLLFKPGSMWHYSDGGPNWLAECITLVYRRDLKELLFERVFGPIGIKPSDLRWRENAYRPHTLEGIKRREFGSGISANVDAMARIGYLYLREGRWRDERILPKDFVDAVRKPIPGVIGLPEYDSERFGNASDHYGLLWWNNADGTLKEVPRDAYWSWGLYDSLIVVIPSLDIVVARAGRSWQRGWGGHYEVLRPFLEPIAASIRKAPCRSTEQAQSTQLAQRPNSWIKRSPLEDTPPSPRLGYEGACVWDSKHHVVIRYGGHNQGGGGEQGSEIWIFDPLTARWELKEPNTSPPGVCCAAQDVFDTVQGRFIRFPAFSGSHGWQWHREIYLNDSSVWTYDPEANIWHNMRPLPEPHIAPLRCASWDSDHQVVVLFGGEGSREGTLVYDPYGNEWTWMNPSVQPAFRSGGNMAYDAAHKLHILFGSQFTDDPHTWAYDLQRDEWRDMKPTTMPPTNKNDAVLTYDPVNRRKHATILHRRRGRARTGGIPLIPRLVQTRMAAVL